MKAPFMKICAVVLFSRAAAMLCAGLFMSRFVVVGLLEDDDTTVLVGPFSLAADETGCVGTRLGI